MGGKWNANPTASLSRRLGKSSHELEQTGEDNSCPDIWELDNGDVVVIGQDMTANYIDRLPEGVSVGPDERLIVIPRATVIAARSDISNLRPVEQ